MRTPLRYAALSPYHWRGRFAAPWTRGARAQGTDSARSTHPPRLLHLPHHRHRAAVPAGLADQQRRSTQRPGRCLHRRLGVVRDRVGRRRHGDLLVDLRAVRHHGAHPGRWLRHHDDGDLAGDPRGRSPRLEPDPRRAERDQRDDDGQRQGHPADRRYHRRAHRGRRRHLPGAAVLHRLRAFGRVGPVARFVPLGVGLQQRRLRVVQRQPHELQPGHLHHRADQRRDRGRRARLPGVLRTLPAVAHPVPLDRPLQGHHPRLPRPVDHRVCRVRRGGVEQPRHDRPDERVGQDDQFLDRRDHAAHGRLQRDRLWQGDPGDPGPQRRPDVHRWWQRRHGRRYQGRHVRPAGLRHLERDPR
ncbi:MAG: hypothetical protein BWY91_02897 [bacterium ADurb.BinA028]|nr:MAG: hypothetical protein BWY91_02897 [bacterium ADurb.BinA028]